MKKYVLILLLALGALTASAQGLPSDGPLTIRPMLQQLGLRLLQGKTGSIVAVRPETGELLCLATNSPQGFDVSLAIARPYAPGSTFKTAQALAMLSEGVITPETTVECHKGITQGNIHVGCHQYRSPLDLRDAIAFSCNSWFLTTFASMINDDFMYESKDEAIDTWRDYMRSMGLGGPLNIDIPGEKGGLLANSVYLKRRYKDGWNGQTIWWAGMGQGDVTLTPLQLCNLAATIANRGYYFIPHIHQATASHPLPQRFLTRRQTIVSTDSYQPVIDGMRRVVEKGTATSIRTSYPICGKTGTVENAGRDHSAFIGFAPENSPQIAIAVYIEHGGFGSDLAAPIAGLIMECYLKGALSAKSEQRAKRLAAIATP